LQIRLLPGDELELRGPRAARNLSEHIREHKAEIVAALRANPDLFGPAGVRFLDGSQDGTVTGFRPAPELNPVAAERAAFRCFVQGG
jgi:hypothetical protein